MKYAQNTQVSYERSRNEIENLLTRYGATQFVYGWLSKDEAIIGFRYKNRMIRFDLVMPKRDCFGTTDTRRKRKKSQVEEQLNQEKRRVWRSLSLAIKAKLEACETSIATFEDEFLAYTILPNSQAVGDWAHKQLADAYENKTMPAGLLMVPKGGKGR